MLHRLGAINSSIESFAGWINSETIAIKELDDSVIDIILWLRKVRLASRFRLIVSGGPIDGAREETIGKDRKEPQQYGAIDSVTCIEPLHADKWAIMDRVRIFAAH